MEKEQAIKFLLNVLQSRMALLSKPTREQAFKLVEENDIKVVDLLSVYVDILQNM